ncbi:MAG: undecaprenyl-phosphate glucose phosphotransferase [Lachnospiraceae bacterium]|nr:undecaprenyl-phosphate glucose phosphotransferase [Lachnospiraceae bacterium]
MVGVYFLTYALFFFVIPDTSVFGGRFSENVTAQDYRLAILYIAPLHMLLYFLVHLYRPMRVTGRRIEALRIFAANLISIFLIIVVFWLFVRPYSANFSRMFLFEFGILNTFFLVLERNLVRLAVVSLRKKGFNAKHILVVGYSEGCRGLLKRIRENARWGYKVAGVLDDRLTAGDSVLGYPVLGPLSMLQDILGRNEIEEVFVTLELRDYTKLESVVQICEKAGIMTKFVPDYGNLMSNRPYTEDLLGLPVIYVRQVPLNDMLNAFMKRAVDIFGSIFALTLFSPVMLITALLIKLTSKGPVIFKQERVGLHNKPFMMYKFRSMVVQTAEAEEKGWTKKNDARVTPVGMFIRRTSIDELPQLINVLSGKMSLIGPRPERPQFVEKFKEEIPRYMVKHQVRPGLTGWAQVNGLRGDTSIEERIKYDIFYIENWSLGFDFKILFMTFFKGFVNKNAY